MASSRAAADKAVKAVDLVVKELHKVIVGQELVIRQFLWAFFAGGHTLIIGVPGLAKTLLIRTLSQVLDLSFSRIQFTPDLMPSDIIGTEIIEDTRGGRGFRFVQGPVFANIVLGDEINRSPPKTQSALLQAMQEKHVTVGTKTYPLDLPFFVLATQNPIEQEGTYPLPEAQLDRFMFSVHITYPSLEEEKEIVRSKTSAEEPRLKRVLSKHELLELQSLVHEVPVSDFAAEYAIKMVRATRPQDTDRKYVKDYVTWGAGPRASQYLVLAAKAKCLLEGKNAVSRQDIDAVSHPVLQHRIITNFNASSEGVSSGDIIDRLLKDQADGTPKGR
jgi:MoxR-like ATPase